MSFRTLLSAVVLVLVAIFCVQNAGATTVRFLGWHLDVSQALVILLPALLGALAGYAAGSLRRRPPPPPGASPPPADVP